MCESDQPRFLSDFPTLPPPPAANVFLRSEKVAQEKIACAPALVRVILPRDRR
jgi:hypothetical protein